MTVIQDQPYPYEADLARLIRIYRQAQEDIATMVSHAIAAENLTQASRRRVQLAAVIARLDQLGAQTDSEARDLVRAANEQAAARTARQIAGLQIDAPETAGAFGQVNEPALTALEDSLLGRLKAARDTIGRSVDDVYGKAGRRAGIRAILGADNSPQAARRELVRELLRNREIRRAVEHGGPGFVDKAGRGWNLDTYAQMATRTITREAVTQGALARMASHGIALARISTHAHACPICEPWEGRLVSLDGATGAYQGEAVTDLASLPNGGPPFHPNCAHSLMPVAVAVDKTRARLAQATA